MSFDSLLNTTAVIQKRARTQDATSGEYTYTYTTKYNGVRCRVNMAGRQEAFGDNRILERFTHVIFIQRAYKVKCTDRIIADGSTYDILLVADAGGQHHHTQLLCEYVA